MTGILNVEIAMNGKIKLIINTDNDLGREILKRKFSTIEVTTKVESLVGKVIPEGSLVITEE